MANKKVSQLTSKPSVLKTDLFPIADPSTGQLFKTTISDLGTAIGSGVSSVNTLVGAVVLDTDDIQELASPTNRWFTDTRARAALSASSPLTYNSGTGAFGIQVATGSQNGYLSSTDWTTFNAKQAALSGTGFVKISGTTISYDNSTYLTTSAAASTYLPLAGGTLTGPLNGTSATFTGDLTLSGTNPRLYFTDTDNNPDYFISNTDGTFTVYDVTNSTARFTIGTTGNATFTNAITGGGSITGQSLYSNGIISAGTTISAQGAFFESAASTTEVQFKYGGNLKSKLYHHNTNNTLTLGTYNTGGNLRFEVDNNVGALTIANTGAATFSSSVTQSASDSRLLGGDTVGRYIISNSDTSAYMAIYGSSHATVANNLSLITNSLISFTTGSGYSERMRITSDGRLLVSTTVTNPGQNNTDTGNALVGGRFFFNNGGSDNIIGRNTDGTLISWRRGGVEVGTIGVTSSATSYNTSSDYRLKQDLKSFDGLNLVNQIKAYDYQWKSDNTRSFGVLAHELAEVLPYAVQGVKDGERMQAVDYSKIVPVMIQAIKELKAELDTLKK